MSSNKEKAFLDVIAYAEGTLGVSQNGYDIALSFRVINGWTPNTDIAHGINNWRIDSLNSNAAGRYQFIGSTWIELNNGVNLPLTSVNQDRSAIKLANRKKTKLNNINSRGDFYQAVSDLKPIWASFQIVDIGVLWGVYQEALKRYNEKFPE